MTEIRETSFNGACCFKCVNYHPERQANVCDINGTIGGIASHVCDLFALAKDRWYSLTVQAWEHERGIDAKESAPIANGQRTLEAYL